MSMYLPNDDVQPTGAEGAEFIDTPMPAVDTAPEDGTDDAAGDDDDATDDAANDDEAGSEDDRGEGQQTS